MTYLAKQGILKYTIFDKTKAKVSSIYLKKGSYIAENSSNEQILYIYENTHFCLSIKGNSNNGIANIYLAASTSLVHPPRAEYIKLIWNGIEFIVNQTDYRDFQIFCDNTQIANIIGMFKRFVYIEILNYETVEFITLIFILAHRMLHEDDIEIV